MYLFSSDYPVEKFLTENWEKKPLVLKGVITDPQNIIEQEDLFEMACDDYFISRIIGQDDQNNWNVTDGPFSSEELSKNQLYKWTLVNHNLNLYEEKIHHLQKELEFLPSWLFDDAMTTLSNKGSSVGAHIDNYNVFIIQLKGRREWKIQHRPNPKFQTDLPVKILEEFAEDETFILEPGDMIYIPPHVAHHGISLDDSLSLSLGFKSIEYEDLLKNIAVNILEDDSHFNFYKTQFKHKVQDPIEIDQKNLECIKEELKKLLNDDQYLERSILKFASKSKGLYEPNEDLDFNNFLDHFKQTPLVLDEFCKFAIIRQEQDLILGINGIEFKINEGAYQSIKKIQNLPLQERIRFQDFQSISDLIYSLYREGFCYFDENE